VSLCRLDRVQKACQVKVMQQEYDCEVPYVAVSY
jgi:hypothetical protein